MACGLYWPISKTQLLIGVLQFATTWAVVGYFWAIGWGILLFREARKLEEEQPLAKQVEVQTFNERPVIALPKEGLGL